MHSIYTKLFKNTEDGVVFKKYEKWEPFTEVMELHTFNDFTYNDQYQELPHLKFEVNIRSDRLPYNVDEELIKDIGIDIDNNFGGLKKSGSMCNLLNLNDSQSTSYINSDFKKSEEHFIEDAVIRSSTPKHMCVTNKNISRVHGRRNSFISNVEKTDESRNDKIISRNDLNSNIQQYCGRQENGIDYIRSSIESLHLNNQNKSRMRRSVSKSTLVNKFLQSIQNRTENKPVNKFKSIKQPCSLYIKNAVVDNKYLQDATLNHQISREIAIFSGDVKSDVLINSKVETFLRSQTFTYPNEKLYKVFKALDLNGCPTLVVLTDYSVYLIGIGSCCCVFKLLYTICYENLAAIAIGPFAQLALFINKVNKKTNTLNWASIYNSARQFAMYLEIAVRKWSAVNSKDLFFSAVEINEYCQMECFYGLIADDTLPKNEDVVFLTWVWLQEEYVDVSPLGPCKESYMMFKGGNCGSWIPSYIRLKGGVLYVFDSVLDRLPKYTIELLSACKKCGYAGQSDRPYSFEIVKENTTFLFGAANELEMTEWVQILIEITKGLSNYYSDDKEVAVRGYFLLMTTSRIIIYAYPNQVTSHCSLNDIVNFKRSNNSRDLYCLLEFDCREALEEGGDWILHFVSKETNEIFCSQLEKLKPNLFLEIESVIENESLINRCRRINFKLQSMWDPFFTNISFTTS